MAICNQSFYGVILSSENRCVECDIISNDEYCPRRRRLIIKQILLGAEAKEGEFNVVQVHTARSSHIPLAVLKAGDTRVVYPNIELYDTSATFKLIAGNGPVYIHGKNIEEESFLFDILDDYAVDRGDDADEVKVNVPP